MQMIQILILLLSFWYNGNWCLNKSHIKFQELSPFDERDLTVSLFFKAVEENVFNC